MNIFILILIVFIILYLFLNWFAKSSSKKIYQILRKAIIWIAFIFAIVVAVSGRYIFSLPFLLAILPLIKTKAGITLFQLLRLWGFFRVLKNSRDEAYKVLNLNPKKTYKKDEVLKSYKKIMKKIHPDLNPELNRLASIVNESKDIVLKDIT